MSSIIKTIIIVVVIAGVGFMGYSYLIRVDTTGDALISQDSSDTSKIGADVLTALNQLKTLKLDDSIFKDKTFMSLQDFSKPLDPEPIGRINPFSPIGVEKALPAVIASSTKSQTSNTINQDQTSTSSNQNLGAN